MTPWLDDGDVRLYHGDALEVLAELPDGSVDCVVTSPPYWGLRDYGTEGQIGLEETPDLFVANMVAVFREIRRVLADHGTIWCNLGDSYANSGGHAGQGESSQRQGRANVTEQNRGSYSSVVDGLKPKDLVGIPWRVAFALQADGWYLRSDIVWAKPNPMPESVTDRPTKSHEYVFLLTKSHRYFFDQEAVREPHESTRWGGPIAQNTEDWKYRNGGELVGTRERDGREFYPNGGRNIRSVWTIATQPYAQAHFATFPEALARRCIMAGCPERVCRVCGKPDGAEIVRTPLGNGPSFDPTPLTGRKRMNRERRPDEGTRPITRAEQREYARQIRESPRREQMQAEAGPAFAHYVRTDDSGARPLPPDLLSSWIARGWLALAESSGCGHNAWRSGVVLDPFIGSGTVAKVARDHQRHAIGIDLNEQYLKLAARRLQQLSLLTV